MASSRVTRSAYDGYAAYPTHPRPLPSDRTPFGLRRRGGPRPFSAAAVERARGSVARPGASRFRGEARERRRVEREGRGAETLPNVRARARADAFGRVADRGDAVLPTRLCANLLLSSAVSWVGRANPGRARVADRLTRGAARGCGRRRRRVRGTTNDRRARKRERETGTGVREHGGAPGGTGRTPRGQLVHAR